MRAAATMETPATVEAAASAAELSTSVEVATATVAVAAVEVSAAIAAIESACVSAATVVAVAAAAIIPVATVTTVAAAVVAASVGVIPGAGSDEDAAGEPIRSVESVGRASVRIIVVVAISANWRWAVIGRGANSDAEGDALGLRVRSGEETNSETNAE